MIDLMVVGVEITTPRDNFALINFLSKAGSTYNSAMIISEEFA
jgi:hypothetical protein